jgi:hypothetical protein
VLSAPGLYVGEVTLVEQSRPKLIWPVDVILGTGDSAIPSRRWRAFALSHQLLVGDLFIFCFKLGALEASVQVFDADGVCRTCPLSTRME